MIYHKRCIEKILAVDDDETLVHSIRLHLRRTGYEVDVAYDGAMARDMMLKAQESGQPYDMVITDIIMPTMDGTAFVKWLHSTMPDTGLLVISSFSAAEMVNKVLRHGRDGFLKKPMRPADLSRMISRIEVSVHK